jgi:hypothetical protein
MGFNKLAFKAMGIELIAIKVLSSAKVYFAFE